MKRVLPVLAAVLLVMAVAAPAGAATERFRAAGPGAKATWSGEIDGQSVSTGLFVFRQSGTQGPSVMVDRQVWDGDTLISDTFGQVRARVFVAPGLASAAIWPTVITMTTCNGDFSACGAPFDIGLSALAWTWVGDITVNAGWTGPAAPPPFCIDRSSNQLRDATLDGPADPFGGELGPIGDFEGAGLFDVRILWVSVKGGCF